jgi:hypothetical protein
MAFALILLSTSVLAETEDAALQASVQQLRDSVGAWDVTTEFLNEDGSVARSVEGSYEFEWVIEDRVLSGHNEIPEMDMRSGILFYIDEGEAQVEMVSVGKDGRLWIMSGPLGEETRYTQPFESQSGGEAQLRFTRYNVQEETFESRMEYTEDGGETWHPGNHQTFHKRN